MPDDQLEFVLAKLQVVGLVVSRRMFGGVGFYLVGVFFALMMHDRLYFKVDDRNRRDFESAGMEPFRPFADEKVSLSYFEVPERVIQSQTQLKAWAEKALAAARDRAANKRRKASRRAPRKTSGVVPRKASRPLPRKTTRQVPHKASQRVPRKRSRQPPRKTPDK
jgi:DNA transformation protein